MKYRKLTDSLKNAVGTVFLLAGAFFVCSTLVSIRAVFADPIAPTVYVGQSGRQSPRASNSPRGNTSNTINRATNATAVTSGRSVRANASRAVSSRVATSRPTAVGTTATNSTRGATRLNPNATRNIVSTRGAAATTTSRGTSTRNVVARTTTTRGATRNVISRTAVAQGSDARISLQGAAIRGSKRGNTNTSTISYLSNKLYTGDYSNIIDAQTGLISADAYSNCLESYYTCMDEICTARNASQGRCACAYRTKTFAQAEEALEAANEELIKVSGELALLVATKGKDVSAAFQLTDAERIMNCAAYAEIVANGSEADITKWCGEHTYYKNDGDNKISIDTCNKNNAPSYCKDMGDEYGFNLADLGGSGSDILASLRSWAEAKDKATGILVDQTDTFLSSFENMSDLVGDLSGVTVDTSETTLDKLANTWGYDLFAYAHNNVCSRVLDSCFNGIYEACGTPPSGGRCATSASSNCPYNYNSTINVTTSGGESDTVDLTDRKNVNTTSSATCFGYSNSTDPYSHLRGPVADARRSVMQKYILDANAACDVYGEQLRTMAQNIGYQKVAAQQALQQKRLEFAQEEKETILADAIDAGTNFDNCISEIVDCYENLDKKEELWSDQRKKTYCAQIAEVPSCYETMICNPSTSQFRAVIDKADNQACFNSQDYTKNTCRNVVTLNEILNGTGATDTGDISESCAHESQSCPSSALREQCLIQAGVGMVRKWFESDDESTTNATATNDTEE